MKNKAIILLTCWALLMSGCSATKLTAQLEDAINNTEDQSPETAKTEIPTGTPGPKETQLALNKKGKVGDWNICVKKAAIKKKIKDGSYRYYKPNKGKLFVVLSLAVRNKGKKSETFLPRVGYENKMVKATLYYKNEYEYSPTELLSYDKDFAGKTIQPLTTEKGIIAFEIPKKIARAKKNLTLRIGTKSEYLIYLLY